MRPRKYTDDILQYCTGAHRSAADILAALQKNHPDIGQATVYRNIRRLTEEGALTCIPGVSESCLYEKTDHMHAHALDTKTGEVFDIELPTDILQKCRLPKTFDVSSVEVVVRGTKSN